jgi:Na+(H+)/acetate symporter ActP
VLLAAVVTFTRTGGAILLTAASAVSHDLYGTLLRPGAEDRTKVLVSRMAVVVFSAIPVLLALRPFDLVNFVVIYAAKLTVSFLFVPVVVGLHWRGATRAGALASMVGGLSTCILWTLVGRPYFLGLDPAEAGVLASAIAFVGVSGLTAPVAPARLGVFFPEGRPEP